MRLLLLFVFFTFISSSVYSQGIIRIGAPLPITGSLAVEAAKQQRGYDLWAKIVNQSGGIKVGDLYYKVEIVYLDYQSDTKKARRAAETLIKDKFVQLLFAPYGSNAAREASPIAEMYHIPMIAVTASASQAYSLGHKYIFGTFTPNETLTEPISDLVKEHFPNVTRFAILARGDLFPLSIAREINRSVIKRGFEIVFDKRYHVNTTDHKESLLQLKAARPDWIFVAGYMVDLVQIRKQMAELKITAPVVTMIAAPAYQEFIEETGALAENITSAAWWHPAVKYSGIDVFGTTENFVKLFQKRYGHKPDYVEASAALAGALFQIAIERAGTLDGAKVRDKLAKINDNTFWGHVKFGTNGQINSLSPPIFQIQKGEPVIIYPDEISTGQIQAGVK